MGSRGQEVQSQINGSIVSWPGLSSWPMDPHLLVGSLNVKGESSVKLLPKPIHPMTKPAATPRASDAQCVASLSPLWPASAPHHETAGPPCYRSVSIAVSYTG